MGSQAGEQAPSGAATDGAASATLRFHGNPRRRDQGAPRAEAAAWRRRRRSRQARTGGVRPGRTTWRSGVRDRGRAGGQRGGGAPRPGDAEWSLDEEPTTVAPVTTEASAAEPESVEQPIPEPPEAAIFDVDDAELGDIDLDEDATPAERARAEHSDLEDTVDHPAPQVESLSEELENAAPDAGGGRFGRDRDLHGSARRRARPRRPRGSRLDRGAGVDGVRRASR